MGPKNSQLHLLAIDDESFVLDSIVDMLKEHSRILVETSNNAKDAIALISSHPAKYAVVLVDYLMPDMKGAELNRELLKINPDLIIAMHSGDSSREALKESLLSGAVDFIEKGLPASEFRAKILSFCQKFEETLENQLESIFENSSQTDIEQTIQSVGMFGRSPEMLSVANKIKKAATVHSPVLITGESGTGKELVAKAIHNLSTRKSYNFIPVNMGAISHDLFESQMFGHLKGSFTGAIADKIGSFKAANHGTLFLDEIGDMRIDSQVKLLRALQEKEIQAVGANKPEKVDARIVAATNVNLDKAIKEGRFRQDLFYRLHVFPIQVPALRDRPQDIRSLVMHFKKKYRGEKKVFLMEVIRKFEQYRWPGNIRELESEMQKLIEITPEDKITLKHLDGKFFDESQMNVTDLTKLNYQEFKDRQKGEEINYIRSQLKRFGSTREAASEAFKTAESTIRSRINSLKIKMGETYEK